MTNNKRENWKNKLSNWFREKLNLDRFRTSIPSQVRVVFVLLAVIPVITLSILLAIPSIKEVNNAFIEYTFHELEAVRTLKTNQIQAWIIDRKGDALFTRNLVVVKGSIGVNEGLPILSEYKNDPTHPAFVEAYNRANDVLSAFAAEIGGGVYEDIMLVDLDGEIVFALDPRSQGTNLLETGEVDPLFFESALQEIYVGDIRESPLHGGNHLLVAVPVLGPDGETVGVIILEANADVLSTLMHERTGLGETGETYLVGQDNLFRTDSRFLEQLGVTTTILNPDVIVDTTATNSALSGGSGTDIIADYRGVQVLSSWSPITIQAATDSDTEGVHWALIAEVEEAEALATMAALRRFISVLGFSLLVIIGAGAGFLGIKAAKHFVDPIIQLTKSADEITTGNLEGTLPSTIRQDEIGVMTDALASMTSRLKETMDDLRQSKERSRTVSELIRSYGYAYKFDAQGNIQPEWITGDIESVVGYTEEDLRELGVANILHPDEIEASVERMQQILTGKPTSSEYRVITKDGRLRWFQGYNRPMWDEAHNRVIGFIGAARDITERKKAEEALQEYSERLEDMVDARTRELKAAQEQLIRKERLAVLGELAGGVGHELRNPMTGISNAVYYLKTILPEADEKVTEYLEIISQEVINTSKIVSDLLDYGGLKPTDKQHTEIRDVITQAIKRNSAPGNIKVTTRIASKLPGVFVDASQIGQVFDNLLTNAFQAMPDGGQIKIGAKVKQNWVHISVKDSGGGIAEKNQKKIFEPLFTTKARGIGLGLPLSKRLVEANGGELIMESVEGKGSTFTIKLPSGEG
ncbi:MAG: PAS domain S-box protein [Chloroflexi bacterium]|nr:PAS domain S-box protein [Chloroflexota bacterium]